MTTLNLGSIFIYNSVGMNKIGDQGLKILALNFKYISNLQILNLGKGVTEIEENGIHELVENLQFVPNLRELILGEKVCWVEGTHLGENGGKELAKHFRNIPKIEVLNLSNISIYIYIYNIGNNKIGVVGFDAFLKNMKYIPNLRNLNLSKYLFIINQ